MTSCDDRYLRFWRLDRPTFTSWKTITLDTTPKDLWVSRGDRWLAVANATAVRVWDFKAGGFGAEPFVLKGHAADVEKIKFSPDACWLVTADEKGAVFLWDFRGNDPSARRKPLPGTDLCPDFLVFSADSRRLATVDVFAAPHIWDLTRPGSSPLVLSELEVQEKSFAFHTNLATKITRPQIVTDVAFSADGAWLLVGTPDGVPRLWNLNRPGGRAVLLRGHEGVVTAVAFSPDGKTAFTASRDQTARVWRVGTDPSATEPVTLRPIGDSSKPISDLQFSADGWWLVARVDNGPDRWWRLDPTGREVVSEGFASPDDPTPSVEVSPDRVWMVAPDGRGGWELWSLVQGGGRRRTLIDRVPGPYWPRFAFGPNGHALLAFEPNGRVRLWDLRTPNPTCKTLLGSSTEGDSEQVVETGNGAFVAACLPDKTIHVWQVLEDLGNVRAITLPESQGEVNDLKVSDDGCWLAVTEWGGHLSLWNLAVRPPKVRAEVDDVTWVKFTPGSDWLILDSWSRPDRLWDLRGVQGDRPPDEFPIRSTDVYLTRQFADWLLKTSATDGSISLWSLSVPGRVGAWVHLEGHPVNVTKAAGSHDGRWLVTGDAEGQSRLWDLRGHRGPKAVATLLRHDEKITYVAISDDENWVVTGSEDETANLWPLRVGRVEATPITLSGHEGGVSAVAFSPDRRWVATGDNSGIVRVWRMRLGELSSLARGAAGRNFTDEEWRRFFPGQRYRRTFPELPGPAQAEVRPEPLHAYRFHPWLLFAWCVFWFSLVSWPELVGLLRRGGWVVGGPPRRDGLCALGSRLRGVVDRGRGLAPELRGNPAHRPPLARNRRRVRPTSTLRHFDREPRQARSTPNFVSRGPASSNWKQDRIGARHSALNGCHGTDGATGLTV